MKPLTSITGHKILLAEATRFFEKLHPQDDEQANQAAIRSENDFAQKITVRASHLKSSETLTSSLENIHAWHARFVAVLYVILFFIGIAASQALLLKQNDQGVNVYILLAALILPNAVSLLWFLLIKFLPRPTIPVSLASMSRHLMKRFIAKTKSIKKEHSQHESLESSLKAWGELNFQTLYGFWKTASLNHGLWLIFLFGMLLGLIFRMSAHQYFFGWESTLLPNEFFIALSNTLMEPFRWVHLAMPSTEGIINSNIKDNFFHSKTLAQQWAVFVIVVFVCYAIIPRLIAYIISKLKTHQLGKQLTLDTSSIEYAKLYQVLMLSDQDISVVDPDVVGPEKVVATQAFSQHAEGWPSDMLYAYLECVNCPQQYLASERCLGNIIDRDSQKKLLADLASQSAKPFLLVVSLLRLPERGTVRFITKIAQQHEPMYVVLSEAQTMRSQRNEEDASIRLYDWQQALARAGVAADNIMIIKQSQPDFLGTSE